MSDDIVKRCRIPWDPSCGDVRWMVSDRIDAADEIERLREVVQRFVDGTMTVMDRGGSNYPGHQPLGAGYLNSQPLLNNNHHCPCWQCVDRRFRAGAE